MFLQKVEWNSEKISCHQKGIVSHHRTLKNNHNIFYVQEIIVYTDDKNFNYDETKYVSQCIFCQHICILQDYNAKLIYLEGGKNTGVYALTTDKTFFK